MKFNLEKTPANARQLIRLSTLTNTKLSKDVLMLAEQETITVPDDINEPFAQYVFDNNHRLTVVTTIEDHNVRSLSWTIRNSDAKRILILEDNFKLSGKGFKTYFDNIVDNFSDSPDQQIKFVSITTTRSIDYIKQFKPDYIIMCLTKPIDYYHGVSHLGSEVSKMMIVYDISTIFVNSNRNGYSSNHMNVLFSDYESPHYTRLKSFFVDGISDKFVSNYSLLRKYNKVTNVEMASLMGVSLHLVKNMIDKNVIFDIDDTFKYTNPHEEQLNLEYNVRRDKSLSNLIAKNLEDCDDNIIDDLYSPILISHKSKLVYKTFSIVSGKKANVVVIARNESLRHKLKILFNIKSLTVSNDEIGSYIWPHESFRKYTDQPKKMSRSILVLGSISDLNDDILDATSTIILADLYIDQFQIDALIQIVNLRKLMFFCPIVTGTFEEEIYNQITHII